MRLFVLAMVLFLLNLSVVLVDTLGLFNVNYVTQASWRDDVQDIEAKKFDPDISADVSTSFGFGDFVSGFKNFIDMVFRIVNLGETVKLFGVDDEIANTFGLAGIIIYALGLSQFISNRSTKGMQ